MNAIGLDIGTTTLSAVALNAESGQILEAAARRSAPSTPGRTAGATRWWAARRTSSAFRA